MAGGELVTEPKQATSRQRSAFSDAVEILNELYDLGISSEEIIRSMDFTKHEFHHAHLYLQRACNTKLQEGRSNGQS